MQNASSKVSYCWIVSALAYGFIVLTQFDHFQVMGVVSPSDIFLVLLFLALIGTLALTKSMPVPKSFIWLSLLVVLGFGGALASSTPSISIRKAASLIGMALSFLVTYWLLRIDEQWFRRMVSAFIVAGCVISIAAWIQWLTYHTSGTVLWQPEIYGWQQLHGVAFLGDRLLRVTAFYFDPNFVAFYLLPPLVFSFFRFIEPQKNFFRKFLLGVILCVIAGAFVLTFSRGQFLALLVTVSIGLLLSAKRWRNALVVFLLITISAFFIAAFDWMPVIASVRNFNPLAIIARLTVWKYGWLELMNNPWLGVGLGVPVFNPEKPVGNPMMEEHNTYLQVARGTGIIGLAVFLSLLVRPAVNTLRHWRFRRTPLSSAYRYAFIALVVGAFSINVFLIKHFWIILAAQYALMIKRTHWKEKELT